MDRLKGEGKEQKKLSADMSTLSIKIPGSPHYMSSRAVS